MIDPMKKRRYERKIQEMKPTQVRFSEGNDWLLPATKIRQAFANGGVCDVNDREILFTEVLDNYNECGTKIISLCGSPPKGVMTIMWDHIYIFVYGSLVKHYTMTHILDDMWDKNFERVRYGQKL